MDDLWCSELARVVFFRVVTAVLRVSIALATPPHPLASVTMVLQKIVGGGREDVGNNTCEHEHSSQTFNATFAFSFVANPFHRVLTMAVYNQGVDVHRMNRSTSAEEVHRFREFVAKQDARAAGDYPNLPSQSTFLQEFPQTWFIGRTCYLDRDLPHVLTDLLGYHVPAHVLSMQKKHCLSSCPPSNEVVRIADAKRGEQLEYKRDVQWYDDATANRVRQTYARDFAHSTTFRWTPRRCGTHARAGGHLGEGGGHLA